MRPYQPLNTQEPITVAKEIVYLIGVTLGNLINRIYSGTVHKTDWNDADRESVKGTTVFLLGGSICTMGYTRVLLPLIAQRQLLKINPELANKVKIFTPQMASADAGAFGAYYVALPEVIKDRIRDLAVAIYARGRVPVLPLLDIGGTKVSLVLAPLNQQGELTLDILQSHKFATPISEPETFYARLGALLAAPLIGINSSDLFELIPILAVGQPGRFHDSKGPIGEGTARDLGPGFAGCNPSQLITAGLEKHIPGVDVYCANDGRCQFFGIGALSKAHDPIRWQLLHDHKVAYLGMGTGLGAGFGLIDSDGYVKMFLIHNAFDIVEDYARLPFSQHLGAPLLPFPYSYGDVLSGKYFRKEMHRADLERLNSDRPMLFLPRSSAKHLLSVPDQARALLASDERNSPLDAMLLNEILAGETVTAETEEVVDLCNSELKRVVRETLLTIARELDETVLHNVRGCDYDKVIDEVSTVKRRRRRVQFIGIGKSQVIGRDLAYIYSNLGIPSESCELTGANSENLTNIQDDDLVFLISNSGKATELLELLPYIERKNCRTVALTGDRNSPLAELCTYFVNTHVSCNPHPIPEAPTTSTTSALAAGTSIGMVVSYLYDYDAREFFSSHPNLEHNVTYPKHEVRADASFDGLTKIEDIFRRFADSIRSVLDGGEEEFVSSLISLTKRVLVSHYKGRTVFFTGAGSSKRVAEKIAATLTSIGIDASAVNPAQLPHGDFSPIRRGDLLVIISFSGETRQLLHIRDVARRKGADCAIITANRDSKLARECQPGLCLIAGEGAHDTDLVPIPDQKILSSFINLTVGDTLAVVLSHILGRTSAEFASEGHCGGVFARSDGRLSEDQLNKLGGDRVEQIGADPEQLDRINDGLPVRVEVEHLRSYERRKSRGSLEVSEVMVFGMGGIGLAFIAPILNELGKSIWFVESDQKRIDAMREAQFQYTVRAHARAEVSDRTVSRVSVISSADLNSITATALRVDTILTSVGLANIESLLTTFADIVRLRYQFSIEVPLHVVFCENFQVELDPLKHYRHRLREMLGSPELKGYFDRFVGLTTGIDEAIVPEVSPEALAQPIPVESQSAVLFVDREHWCGPPRRSGQHPLPDLGNNVVFIEKLLPLHMRKLWVHNMAHALIGYLGHYCGYKNVCDAIDDPRIREVTRRSMRKVAEELHRRWPYSQTAQPTVDSYLDWRWSRYENESLNDKIERLCRDPERKLKPGDRLLGPANYVRMYAPHTAATDSAIVDILMGVAAAMRYAVEHNNANAELLRVQILEGLPNIDSSLLTRAEEQFLELLASSRAFILSESTSKLPFSAESSRRLSS